MKSVFSLAAVSGLMLASPALAEDYNWTGAYAGVHLGGSWGDASTKDLDGGVKPGPFNYSPSGVLGGATAGYNFQYHSIVFGPEIELGYLDLQGSSKLPSSDPKYHQDLTLDGGFYGVAGGRVGFAFNRALVYAKGGFAYYDGEAEQATTKAYYSKSGTNGFSGFAVGGGLEYALTDKLSLKVEYLHLQFGDEDGSQTKTSLAPAGETDDGTKIGDTFHNRTSLDADTVKVGLSYHFN